MTTDTTIRDLDARLVAKADLAKKAWWERYLRA